MRPASALCLFLALTAAARAQDQEAEPAVTPQPASTPAPPAVPRGVEALETLPRSLMFSLPELLSIEEAAADTSAGTGQLQGQAPGATPVSLPGADTATAAVPDRLRENLYVGAILYFGPDRWTVWINGRPVQPGEEITQFRVTWVSANAVELAVPWGVSGQQTVRMAPNQTLVAATGVIEEGRVP